MVEGKVRATYCLSVSLARKSVIKEKNAKAHIGKIDIMQQLLKVENTCYVVEATAATDRRILPSKFALDKAYVIAYTFGKCKYKFGG